MIRAAYLIIFTIQSSLLSGQLNLYERGQKALYWGISIGANSTNFKIDRQPLNESNDSILKIEDKSIPGFHLGLIGNWQFNPYFDLRAIPNMTFAQKQIIYTTETGIIDNKVKTTYISLPLMLRYKSEPIKDLRVFVVAGMKYEYNVESQYRPPSEPNKIALRQNGLSMEYGIGIQYFFPYFIFSPEIKYSHSLFNMLDPNQGNLTNSAIKGLYPRAFTISINFEG